MLASVLVRRLMDEEAWIDEEALRSACGRKSDRITGRGERNYVIA